VHFTTALITRHRSSRLHRWAMLWLAWFAEFLEAACAYAPLSKQAHAIAHTWLDAIERRIFLIILARAAPHVRTAPRRSYRLHRAGIRRALMGARLRRALRSKDLWTRALKLTQDIGALVTLHRRRIARGLTRLMAKLARPARRLLTLIAAPQDAPALADTS
jgi:hypothetical protein